MLRPSSQSSISPSEQKTSLPSTSAQPTLASSTSSQSPVTTHSSTLMQIPLRSSPLAQTAVRGGANSSPAIRNAVYCNDMKTIITLIQPNQRERDSNGALALWYAAAYNRFQIIELLVNAKISVNVLNKNKATALHIAAVSGSAESVEQLLKRDAEINLLTERDNTALQLAASKGYTTIVELLIKAAIEKKVEIIPGDPRFIKYTPLHAAINNNHPSVVEVLMRDIPSQKGMDLKTVTNPWLNPALHLAASQGRTSIVEMLLNARADIDQQDRDLQTPLLLAAMKGHTDTFQKLLERRANIYKEKKSSFVAAASGGHLAIVQLLLRAAIADEKITNANENQQALETDEIKSVIRQESAPSEGVALRYETDYRMALEAAVANNHGVVVSELLKAPIKPEIKQSARKSLLEPAKDVLNNAIRKHHATVIEALLPITFESEEQRGMSEKYFSLLQMAMKHKCPEPIMLAFLKCRMRRSLLKSDELVVVQYAAAMGQPETIDKLLFADPTEEVDSYRAKYRIAFSAARSHHQDLIIIRLAEQLALKRHLPHDLLSHEELKFAMGRAAAIGHEKYVKSLLNCIPNLMSMNEIEKYELLFSNARRYGQRPLINTLVADLIGSWHTSYEKQQLIIIQSTIDNHARLVEELLPSAFPANNPHAKKSYLNALSQAVRLGHTKISEMLLTYAQSAWHLVFLSEDLINNILNPSLAKGSPDIVKQVLVTFQRNMVLSTDNYSRLLQYAIATGREDILQLTLQPIEEAIQRFQAYAKLCKHPMIQDKLPAMRKILANVDSLLEATNENLMYAIEKLEEKIASLPSPFIEWDWEDSLRDFYLEVNQQLREESLPRRPSSLHVKKLIQVALSGMKEIATTEQIKATLALPRDYNALLTSAVTHRDHRAVKALLGYSLSHLAITPSDFKKVLLAAIQQNDLPTLQEILQYSQFPRTMAVKIFTKECLLVLTEALMAALKKNSAESASLLPNHQVSPPAVSSKEGTSAPCIAKEKNDDKLVPLLPKSQVKTDNNFEEAVDVLLGTAALLQSTAVPLLETKEKGLPQSQAKADNNREGTIEALLQAADVLQSTALPLLETKEEGLPQSQAKAGKVKARAAKVKGKNKQRENSKPQFFKSAPLGDQGKRSGRNSLQGTVEALLEANGVSSHKRKQPSASQQKEKSPCKNSRTRQR